jgi:hypothetical protein
MSTNVNKSILSVKYQRTIPDTKIRGVYTFPFPVVVLPSVPTDWQNPADSIVSSQEWNNISGIHGLRVTFKGGNAIFSTVELSQTLEEGQWWQLRTGYE